MQACLVETTTVDDLLQRVKKGKFKSKEAILETSAQAFYMFDATHSPLTWSSDFAAKQEAESSELVATAAQLSMKCPVRMTWAVDHIVSFS
jgi:hypothetical protein